VDETHSHAAIRALLAVRLSAYDVERKATERPTLVSIAVPYAEPAAATLNVVIASWPSPEADGLPGRARARASDAQRPWARQS